MVGHVGTLGGSPYSALTDRIIGCCIDVHREIGPGLMESVYLECLTIALEDAGLVCEREGRIDVWFRGKTVGNGFRFDLRVEDTVLIEIKSVEALLPVHKSQIINYLRLTGNPLGLLVNFNVPVLKNGLHRLINPSRAS